MAAHRKKTHWRAEAREQLAYAILAVTNEKTTDDDLLKCKALSVFALSYADPVGDIAASRVARNKRPAD